MSVYNCVLNEIKDVDQQEKVYKQMSIPQDLIKMMHEKGILEYKLVRNRETNTYDIFIKFEKSPEKIELGLVI